MSPGSGTTGSWTQIPMLPTNSYLGKADNFPESQFSSPYLLNTQLHQKANMELDITAPLLLTHHPHNSPC